MSAPFKAGVTELLYDSNTRADVAAADGTRWVETHSEAFSLLPTGTVVIINVVDGAYETGEDFVEAQQNFDKRFGTSAFGVLGWVHRIRDRTFIGGGLG